LISSENKTTMKLLYISAVAADFLASSLHIILCHSTMKATAAVGLHASQVMLKCATSFVSGWKLLMSSWAAAAAAAQALSEAASHQWTAGCQMSSHFSR
jgi:hypothetical protein